MYSRSMLLVWKGSETSHHLGDALLQGRKSLSSAILVTHFAMAPKHWQW